MLLIDYQTEIVLDKIFKGIPIDENEFLVLRAFQSKLQLNLHSIDARTQESKLKGYMK